MGNLSCWKKAYTVFVLCAATAIAAPPQTFTTLLSFDRINGNRPVGELVQGVDGNFYGATQGGGAYNSGTIFKITPDGTLTTLYSFCFPPSPYDKPHQTGCPDGILPVAGLVLATDGNFYGSTAGGGANGYGTVFKITPGGDLTTLYSFCSQANCTDGFEPLGPLSQGIDGNLYGTNWQGGDPTCSSGGGCGTVFKITPNGTLTTLHSFDGTDGSYPQASLVQGTDGNFYGTTDGGGYNTICSGVGGHGCGTVFKITPSGTLTTLHKFCSSVNPCTGGKYPASELVQATDGNFYGTAFFGGSGNCKNGGFVIGCGTVFNITPSGTLTTLHRFDGTDGAFPYAGLIQATDGNVYGVTLEGGANTICGGQTSGCGTVFEITLSGTLTTLYNFCSQSGCTDGYIPAGALVQDTNGNFYGTTGEGGDNTCNAGFGCGTVFSLSTGLGP